MNTLELFPYATNTLLGNRKNKLNILRLIEFFIAQFILSIKDFYYKQTYAEFDAHVGETLCQIRAYKIWLMANNSSKFNIKNELNKFLTLQTHIRKCLKDFEELIKSQSKYQKTLDACESLEQFLNKQNLIFTFHEDIFFLLQAKLLTIFNVKHEGISHAINYELFETTLNVGKTLAKKITRYYQKNLAKVSCNFIKSLLNTLPNHEALKLALPFFQLEDFHQRVIFPCYEVTQILLTHFLIKKVPILIIAYQNVYANSNKFIKLLFLPNVEKQEYELRQDLLDYYWAKPCIIIKGLTTFDDFLDFSNGFIKQILLQGLTNVILANMAEHPQYSAKELQAVSDNPYQVLLTKDQTQSDFVFKFPALTKYTEPDFKNAVNILHKNLTVKKQLAKTLGCCLENPTFFYIKHIFCDTIEHQLNYLHDSAILQYQEELLV